MKRHIYLNMKSVEEAREIFLSRFDLDTIYRPRRFPRPRPWAGLPRRRFLPGCLRPTITVPPWTVTRWRPRPPLGPARINPCVLELGSQAFPVNTGNALPRGTNAVIMVENVNPVNETHIRIEAAAYPWQHVRKVGEDLVAHEMVLPEKTEVTPYAMGALLAAGVTRLLVRRRPRVVIIPTGDELISVAEIEQRTRSRRGASSNLIR